MRELMSEGTSNKTVYHRLSKIEGQIRGIARMVEDGRKVPDVLQQLRAIYSALKAAEANIIEDYLNENLNNSYEISQIIYNNKPIRLRRIANLSSYHWGGFLFCRIYQQQISLNIIL